MIKEDTQFMARFTLVVWGLCAFLWLAGWGLSHLTFELIFYGCILVGTGATVVLFVIAFWPRKC